MDDVAAIDTRRISLQLQQSTTGCQQTRLNPIDIMPLQGAPALMHIDPHCSRGLWWIVHLHSMHLPIHVLQLTLQRLRYRLLSLQQRGV